ncbi:MAG: T9SS type A sorting domain-containing protein [Bacteroidales bacterium]|jgi:hypothetical protein
MKPFFTLLILAVITISSYSQNKKQFDQKVDSMIVMNRQNHNYLDTLWVLDSSVHFREILNLVDGLEYERTYKVLSRNEHGNLVSALDWANENLLIYTGNSVYDSLVYFDGVQVKKQFSNAWNSVEKTWIDDGYEEYEAPGLLKEKFFKGFSDNAQQYFYGYRKSYDNSNGHLDTLFTYTYDQETGSWQTNEKTVLFCDAQNNDTLIITYKWVTGGWEAKSKTQAFYEGNLLMSFISYRPDTVSNTWQNLQMGFYSYNDAGLQESLTFRNWSVQDNSWYDYYIENYTYDNQGRLTNTLVLIYNSNIQQVRNAQNYHTDYLEGSKTETFQTWDYSSELWINVTREYTSYIAEDLIDTLRMDEWDSNEQQWQPDDLSVNKFDNRLNVVENATYGFGYLGMQQWSRIDYFWSPFIPNAIPETKTNALVVYPNPASTQVSFVLPEIQLKTGNQIPIKILDLSSRQIAEIQVNSGNAVWDCSTVKPGMYVYSTLLNGQKITGKIVVMN